MRERETTRDEDLLQPATVRSPATVNSVRFEASTVYRRHTYCRHWRPPRYMVIASICEVDAFVAHEFEKVYVEIDNVYGSRNKNAYLTYHFYTTLTIKNCGMLIVIF